jgi:hypothetical protein
MKNKTMSYVFRGNPVFEYIPNEGVKLRNIKGYGDIPAFDYCSFINEDYKLMGEFFNTVYRHAQGEKVELKDIEVY